MGEGGLGSSSPYFKFSDVFEKHCPYYLAMGMSYDLYWFGDPNAVKVFRKARKLQYKETNNKAWLQGAYIYQALCSVAPLFRFSGERVVQARPYLNEPFNLELDDKDKEGVTKTKQNMQKASFEVWAVNFNARFKAKECNNG